MQLERRAVDAVVRRQRRGEHEPRDEGGPPAALQRARAGCPACSARRWAGSTRATGDCASSVKYSVSSVLRVAPGEVGVGLREAELGEPVHDLRARERFGEKDHVGMGAA